MNVKYITDDSGERSAVIVPLEEWESITAKINAFQEDLEMLSPEDEIERREAYDEMKRGETLNLREAVKIRGDSSRLFSYRRLLPFRPAKRYRSLR